MSGTKRVVFTELFWQTLEPLRSHPRYESIRSQIEEMLVRRSLGMPKMSARDKMFTEAGLKGIWHWPCSRNPDIVLFYTVEGDTVYLAMMGSHHDYSHGGKHRGASERTAKRVKNAVSVGALASPDWKTFPWKEPADILGYPYLHELSKSALAELSEVLYREMKDAPLFEVIHGKPLAEVDEVEIFMNWMETAEMANRAVEEAMRLPPPGPEEALERMRERRPDLVQGMSF